MTELLLGMGFESDRIKKQNRVRLTEEILIF